MEFTSPPPLPLPPPLPPPPTPPPSPLSLLGSGGGLAQAPMRFKERMTNKHMGPSYIDPLPSHFPGMCLVIHDGYVFLLIHPPNTQHFPPISLVGTINILLQVLTQHNTTQHNTTQSLTID